MKFDCVRFKSEVEDDFNDGDQVREGKSCEIEL